MLVCLSTVFLAVVTGVVSAQTVKRITTKTDRFDFGSGGTVSIIGAPTGTITVVGSQKNEIEITAKIEIQAGSEAELDRLAQVTTFGTDESLGRVTIISSGTHNKLGDKKEWKKFPKALLGLPFSIDYVVSLPRYTDLEISGGKGDLSVSGVEGALKLTSVESNSKLDLIGGGVSATFGSGTVDITMPNRSWRGNAIDVALSSGTMSVHLPASISAEIDATIVKTGKIENAFVDFKPRTRTVPFTERSILAKAGSGGISMKFTVGDGTLKLLRVEKPVQ